MTAPKMNDKQMGKWGNKICSQDFTGGSVDGNLPAMPGKQVKVLVQDDSACHGATKLVHHNYEPPCSEVCTP